VDGVRGTFDTARRGITRGLSATRQRVPPLDHAIRAYGRYGDDAGDRLAASATYYAFLSFFPVVAILFAAMGFVVDSRPDLKDEVVKQINGYLPGLADKLNISNLGTLKVGIGLIGLVGLLLAGLAWISALRDAIRLLWHQDTDSGNLVTRRVRDVRVLVGLGLLMVVSLALTSVATSANGVLLRATGMTGSPLAAWSAAVLGLLIALVADVLVFLYLFWRLPRRTSRRAVLRAALLGAAGIEVFKLLGTWLVGKTTSNPMYGTFAVLVGLLIWINIVMRWTLFAAAWAVTAPGSSDVYPSGTADRSREPADDEQAPEAGVPAEVGTQSEAGAQPPADQRPAAGQQPPRGQQIERGRADTARDAASEVRVAPSGHAGEPGDRSWLADRFRTVVSRRRRPAPPASVGAPSDRPRPSDPPGPASPPRARPAPAADTPPAVGAPTRGADGRRDP